MRIARLSFKSLAVFISALMLAGTVTAAERDASVPNNWASGYIGFTSVSNADVTITGNDASWIGSTPKQKFSVTLNDLEQKNNIWGGAAFGHWFKQYPISLGMSGSVDVYDAIVKEQTKTNVPFTVGTTSGKFTSFTKFQTNVRQIVPAFNLMAGIPLGICRIYGGVGPGIFFSLYSFTVKSGGKEVGTVEAFDAKIGFNAFAGADFFITRNFSVFGELKYSQVNNLVFEPETSDPLIAGRQVRDEYDSIKTQRIGIGAAFHF